MDYISLYENWQKQNRYNKSTVDANGDGKVDSDDTRFLKNEEKSLLSLSNLDLNNDGNFDYHDLIQLGHASKDVNVEGGDGVVDDDEKSFFEYLHEKFTEKLSKNINKNKDLTVNDMVNLEEDIRNVLADETIDDEQKTDILDDLEIIQNRMSSNLTAQIFVTKESETYKANAEANAKAIWNAQDELITMNASEDNPFNTKLENLLDKLEDRVVETLSETKTEKEIQVMKARILPTVETENGSANLSDEDSLEKSRAIVNVETAYYTAMTNDTTEDDATAKSTYDEKLDSMAVFYAHWQATVELNIPNNEEVNAKVETLKTQLKNEEISQIEYNYQYTILAQEVYEDFIANRAPVDSTEASVMTVKNEILYKNDELYTGLYKTLCYENGMLVNDAEYKGKYYVDGKLATGFNKDGSILYGSNSEKYTGLYTEDGLMYVDGQKLTGIYEQNNKYYENGAILAVATYNDTLYVKGVALTGEHTDGLYYINGKPGNDFDNGILYQDGYAYCGLYENSDGQEQYYEFGTLGTGLFKNKYYINGDLGSGICEEDGCYYIEGNRGTGFYNNKYYLNGDYTNAPEYITDFVDEYAGALGINDETVLSTLIATSETEFYVMMTTVGQDGQQTEQKVSFEVTWADEEHSSVTSVDKTYNLVSDVLQTDTFNNGDDGLILADTILTLQGATEDTIVEFDDIYAATDPNNFDIAETIPTLDGTTQYVAVYEAINDNLTKKRYYSKDANGDYQLGYTEICVGNIDTVTKTKAIKSFKLVDGVTVESLYDGKGMEITDESVDGFKVQTTFIPAKDEEGKDVLTEQTIVIFDGDDESIVLTEDETWSLNSDTITIMRKDYNNNDVIMSYDKDGNPVVLAKKGENNISRISDADQIAEMQKIADKAGVLITQLQNITFEEVTKEVEEDEDSETQTVITNVTIDGIEYTVTNKDDGSVKLSKIVQNGEKKVAQSVTIQETEDGGRTETFETLDILPLLESSELALAAADPTTSKTYTYDKDNKITGYTEETKTFTINGVSVSDEKLTKLSETLFEITETCYNLMTDESTDNDTAAWTAYQESLNCCDEDEMAYWIYIANLYISQEDIDAIENDSEKTSIEKLYELITLQAAQITKYTDETKTERSQTTETQGDNTVVTTSIVDKTVNPNQTVLKEVVTKDKDGKEQKFVSYDTNGVTVKETQLYTYTESGKLSTVNIYDGFYAEKDNKLTETMEYTYNAQDVLSSTTVKSYADNKLVSQNTFDANDNLVEKIMYNEDGKTIEQTIINTYKNSVLLSSVTYNGEYKKDGTNQIYSVQTYDTNGDVTSTDTYEYWSNTSNLMSITSTDSDNNKTKIVTYNTDGKTVSQTEVFSTEKIATIGNINCKVSTTYVGEYKENSANKIKEKEIYYTYTTTDETTGETTENKKLIKTYTYDYTKNTVTIDTYYDENGNIKDTVVSTAAQTINSSGTIVNADAQTFAKSMGLTNLVINEDGSFTAQRDVTSNSEGYKVTFYNFTATKDAKDSSKINYSYTEVISFLNDEKTGASVEIISKIENNKVTVSKARLNGDNDNLVYVNADTLNLGTNTIAYQIQATCDEQGNVSVYDCTNGTRASGIIRCATYDKSTGTVTTKLYLNSSFDAAKNNNVVAPVIVLSGSPQIESDYKEEQKDKPEKYKNLASVSSTYTQLTSSIGIDTSSMTELTYEYPVGTSHTITIDEDEDNVYLNYIQPGKNAAELSYNYAETVCLLESVSSVEVETNLVDNTKATEKNTPSITVSKVYDVATGKVSEKDITLPDGTCIQIDADAEVKYNKADSLEKISDEDGMITLKGTLEVTSKYSDKIKTSSVYEMDGTAKTQKLYIDDKAIDLSETVGYEIGKDSSGNIVNVYLKENISEKRDDEVVKTNAWKITTYDVDANVTNFSLFFSVSAKESKTIYVPQDSVIDVNDENNVVISSADGSELTYSLTFANEEITVGNTICPTGELMTGSISNETGKISLGTADKVSFYGDYIFVIKNSDNSKTVYKNDNLKTGVTGTFFDNNTCIDNFDTMINILNNYTTQTGENITIEDYSSINFGEGTISLTKKDGEILTINYSDSVYAYQITKKVEGTDNVYMQEFYYSNNSKVNYLIFNYGTRDELSTSIPENSTITLSDDNKYIIISSNDAAANDETKLLYTKILKYNIEDKSLTEATIKIKDKEYPFVCPDSYYPLKLSEDGKSLLFTTSYDNENTKLEIAYPYEDTTASVKYTLTIGDKKYENIECDVKDVSTSTNTLYIFDGETETEYNLKTGDSIEHKLSDLKTLVEAGTAVTLPEKATVEVTNDEIKITTSENPIYELVYEIDKKSIGYTVGALKSGKVTGERTTYTFAAGSTLSYYENNVIVTNGTNVKVYDCSGKMYQVDDNDAFSAYANNSTKWTAFISLLEKLRDKSKADADEPVTINLNDVTKISSTTDKTTNMTIFTIKCKDRIVDIYQDNSGNITNYSVKEKTDTQEKTDTYTVEIAENIKLNAIYQDDEKESNVLEIKGKSYNIPKDMTYAYDEADKTLTFTQVISDSITLTLQFSTEDGTSIKSGNKIILTASNETRQSIFDYSEKSNISIASDFITIYNDEEEESVSFENLDIVSEHKFLYNLTKATFFETIGFTSTYIDDDSTDADEVSEKLIAKYNELKDSDYEERAILRYFVTLDVEGNATEADGQTFIDAFKNKSDDTFKVSKEMLDGISSWYNITKSQLLESLGNISANSSDDVVEDAITTVYNDVNTPNTIKYILESFVTCSNGKVNSVDVESFRTILECVNDTEIINAQTISNMAGMTKLEFASATSISSLSRTVNTAKTALESAEEAKNTAEKDKASVDGQVTNTQTTYNNLVALKTAMAYQEAVANEADKETEYKKLNGAVVDGVTMDATQYKQNIENATAGKTRPTDTDIENAENNYNTLNNLLKAYNYKNAKANTQRAQENFDNATDENRNELQQALDSAVTAETIAKNAYANVSSEEVGVFITNTNAAINKTTETTQEEVNTAKADWENLETLQYQFDALPTVNAYIEAQEKTKTAKENYENLDDDKKDVNTYIDEKKEALGWTKDDAPTDQEIAKANEEYKEALKTQETAGGTATEKQGIYDTKLASYNTAKDNLAKRLLSVYNSDETAEYIKKIIVNYITETTEEKDGVTTKVQTVNIDSFIAKFLEGNDADQISKILSVDDD